MDVQTTTKAPLRFSNLSKHRAASREQMGNRPLTMTNDLVMSSRNRGKGFHKTSISAPGAMEAFSSLGSFEAVAQEYAQKMGYSVLTHQYPLIYEQVKVGLFVLKRLGTYLKKLWESKEHTIKKMEEVTKSEQETKYTQMEKDMMGPLVSAIQCLHLNDLHCAQRLRELVNSIESLVISPLMSCHNLLENKLKDIAQTYSKAVNELAKANDKLESEQTASSKAMSQLKAFREKAAEKGVRFTHKLKRLIKAEEKRKEGVGIAGSGYKGTIKEGWLEKQGQYNKSYKRRWFKIDDTDHGLILLYYKAKGDKKPQGSVTVDGTAIKANPSTPTQFQICTSGRTYVLRAETAELCQQWVNALLENRKEVNRAMIQELLAAKEKAFKLTATSEESRKTAEEGLRKYTMDTLPCLLRDLQNIDKTRISIIQSSLLRYQKLKKKYDDVQSTKDIRFTAELEAVSKLDMQCSTVIHWIKNKGLPPPLPPPPSLPYSSADFETDNWFASIGLGHRRVRTCSSYVGSYGGYEEFGESKRVSSGFGRHSTANNDNVKKPIDHHLDQSTNNDDVKKPTDDDLNWYRALRDHESGESGALNFRYDDVIVVTDMHLGGKTKGVKHARALYAFEGDESKEDLSFTKGQALIIHGKEEITKFEGWWLASREGETKKGLIPSNYVEIFDSCSAKTAKATKKYTATKDEEINLKEGEIIVLQKEGPVWSMVKKSGRYGLVPAEFLEVLAEGAAAVASNARKFMGYIAGYPERKGYFPAHFVQSVEEEADDYGSDDEDDDDEKEGQIELLESPKSKLGGLGAISLIRAKVSKKKRRFRDKYFDLDLTYIDTSMVAMGFPSEGMESNYRNPMRDVQRFFETRHPAKYWIYNLCSERKYDSKKFHNRVSEHAFDDHNPCPFDYVQICVKEVRSWISSDKDNVAAIHCKAGKGRTGFMIACCLMATNPWFNASRALRLFAVKRTKDCHGVTIPSQIRYVHYYEEYLKGGIPSRCPLRLISVRIIGIPKAVKSIAGSMGESSEVDMWFVLKSNFSREKKSKGLKFKHLNSRGKISCEVLRAHDYLLFTNGFDGIATVDGDVRIEFFLNSKRSVRPKPTKLFRFWLNTRFLKPLPDSELPPTMLSHSSVKPSSHRRSISSVPPPPPPAPQEQLMSPREAASPSTEQSLVPRPFSPRRRPKKPPPPPGCKSKRPPPRSKGSSFGSIRPLHKESSVTAFPYLPAVKETDSQPEMPPPQSIAGKGGQVDETEPKSCIYRFVLRKKQIDDARKDTEHKLFPSELRVELTFRKPNGVELETRGLI